MTTERRTDARGKSSARVTFTDATSDTPSEGELHDIGRGGMFVATKTPLPVGKRIDVDVHAEGSSPITGMARVVWVRDAAHDDLPAGMGIKFIDVDDAALAAIDELVGLKKNVRERTMLGIPAPVKIEAPKVEPAKVEAPQVDPPKKVEPPRPAETAKPPLKSRERTVLGIAPPVVREKELSWSDDEPEPEPAPAPAKKEASAPTLEIGEASLSEPIHFSEPGLTLPKEEEKEPEPVKEPEPEPVKEPEPAVAKAVEPDPAPAKKETPKIVEASMPEPRELPKREGGGGGKWLVVLLLLAVAGGAAYYFRDMIFPPPPAAPTPSATVSASASAVPSVTASAVPTVSATVAETLDAAAATMDAAPEDASVLTTTTNDAGVKDAAHEHDGGRHHDGGAHTHPPHPKPTATGGNENPY